MGESVKGQQEVLKPYPNGNGGRIPFHSRIGTKLIVGFLIIATITGSVGYFGLNYAQTVGEKFHLLEQRASWRYQEAISRSSSMTSIDNLCGVFMISL
jgi:hypothetical protein